jgi:hypothetical protein
VISIFFRILGTLLISKYRLFCLQKATHHTENLQMKPPSTLNRKNIAPEVAELVVRLVSLIPWPARRRAMGDVVLTIMDGKPWVAKNEFGWNRSSVALGIKEFESGITCIDDLTKTT